MCLKLEWSSQYTAAAGVYLAYFDKHDDAKLFLHCSYSAGNRSPFMLEALANVYRAIGDKPRASQYINEASSVAPDDEFIWIEKALIDTGRPPPTRTFTDPIDSAIAELEQHVNRVMARFKRDDQLRVSVQEAFSGVAEGSPGEGLVRSKVRCSGDRTGCE